MSKQLSAAEIEETLVVSAVIRAEKKLKDFRKGVLIISAVLSIGAGYFATDFLFGSQGANATANVSPGIVAARARIEKSKADTRRALSQFQRGENAFLGKLAVNPGAVLFAASPEWDAGPCSAVAADFAPVRERPGCF